MKRLELSEALQSVRKGGYMHGKNSASLFLILWTLFNCCICISEINLPNHDHYKVLIFLEQGIEWHLRKRVIILERGDIILKQGYF